MKELNIPLIKGVLRGIDYRSVVSLKISINEWSRVLGLLRVPSDSSVVELGSGISPKIQRALSAIGFKGQLTIVDLDQKALGAQMIMASVLRSGFRVRTCQSDLFDYTLQSTDMLVGNHLIDDVIASEFSQLHNIDYRRIYGDPLRQESFWREVEGDCAFARKTVKKLAKKIGEVRVGAGVVVNHYTSLFDNTYKIESRDRVCYRALDSLREEFEGLGFDNISSDWGFLNSQKRWEGFRKTR